MNIISTCESVEKVLLYVVKRIDTKRYGEMFAEILNYVKKTQKLILRTLLKVSEEKS